MTADHLIVIGRGRLIADTSVADFIRGASTLRVRVRSPQAMQLIDILSQQGIEVAAQSDQGLLEVGGVTAEQIGELAAVQNIVLHELTPIEASLED